MGKGRMWIQAGYLYFCRDTGNIHLCTRMEIEMTESDVLEAKETKGHLKRDMRRWPIE